MNVLIEINNDKELGRGFFSVSSQQIAIISNKYKIKLF